MNQELPRSSPEPFPEPRCAICSDFVDPNVLVSCHVICQICAQDAYSLTSSAACPVCVEPELVREVREFFDSRKRRSAVAVQQLLRVLRSQTDAEYTDELMFARNFIYFVICT